MAKYSLGLDFGTLSCRALVVNVQNGDEVATAIFDYPHGVMDERLGDGQKLGADWALQHPQDYLDALENVIPEAIRRSGARPEDIIGLGLDFTACTLIPATKKGVPLCFLPEFEHEPHAYAKLWKHHAAQDMANKLNELAHARNEKWIERYGGKISSEWTIPKVMQIAREAPGIYEAAGTFIEAADWVVWRLTGNETHNACCAGYKETWSKREGYPSDDFFAALDPKLKNFISDKLSCPVSPIGAKAGGLTQAMAQKTGLYEHTPVAVGIIDAHAAVPAVGISGPGRMLAIIGTSTCHMLLGEEEKAVPGICGYVEDGILPGFTGYEAGQSGGGDHFSWFVKNCVPAAYERAAKEKGVSVYQYLESLASRQKPGESGLVALDWWNGNRSVLVDVDLTGMIVGMTLATRPEDVYRSLIEATAFGTRKIIDNFEEHGVRVKEFYAAGGIADKSPFTMQIYADVINRPIKISGSAQAGALGSAIFGAVAAGEQAGGYANVYEAARRMGKVKDISYAPIPQNVAVYERLYREYLGLHDYFGRGGNDVMKRLKAIKKEAGQNA